MKTKLVPLALLIPAVVLAQPAPPPPSQSDISKSQPQPASTMAVPPVNPTMKSAKAAAAYSSAKSKSKYPDHSKTWTYTKNGKCPSGYSMDSDYGHGKICLET
jgi:hypothetical protein